MRKIILFLIVMLFVFNLSINGSVKKNDSILFEGFVYLKDIIPSAIIDLRYYGKNNFLGVPVDGYIKDRLIITAQAAKALKKVQSDLLKYSMSIKVFDGYRPQRAVNHFVRWAKNIKDVSMKQQYYPEVNKKNLFRYGYIASRSGHSRGSTVDLTIVSVSNKKIIKQKELDMGSSFDFFGKISASEYKKLNIVQLTNRLLLRTLMEKHGFKHYKEEWWHFTLIKEPFPDTFFDFPVQ